MPPEINNNAAPFNAVRSPSHGGPSTAVRRGRRPAADTRDRDLLLQGAAPSASPTHAVARLARGPLAQLERMRIKDPSHGTLYRERAEAVTQHFNALTTWQALGVVASRLFDTVWFARGLLNGMIHPATTAYRAPVLPGDRYAEQLVTEKMAERVHFFTRDHVLLDGLLVGPRDDQARPVLVLGLPNMMSYQAFVHDAASLADSRNVRVLLYNDRGIGRSLGTQHSTGQAVRDCRAALNFAYSRSGDQGIEVFGMSLGGGVTARALAQAQAAGEFTWRDVRRYVNCHSFSSLSKCIGGLMGAWVGVLARGVFALTGMDNLDTLHALRTRRLARQVVVLTAQDDEVMTKAARLGEALADAPTPGIVTILTSPGSHNSIDNYFDPDHAQMRAWAEGAAEATDPPA